MKNVSACFFVAAICSLCFSLNAKADEMAVLKAKREMASALTKAGLLTNSFTEKGKQNPELAGMQIAQQFASNLDNFIVQGLQKNASCEQIEMASSQKMAEGMGKKNEPLNDAAKKASDNLEVSVGKYVAARCADLIE
ncbi:hypothetical protein [Leclercia adecarboxylata]|uniref:hypothetical protein n=1 Tax=Leclercia adecarboxylata TaxID=83655 RepID=UPI0022E1F9A7|nr:hypothetical protein [Leclercia adecarboxylata]